MWMHWWKHHERQKLAQRRRSWTSMIRALTRPQAPLCMPSTTPRIILATEREWYDDHRDLIDRLPKAAHPPLEGKHGKYSYTLAVSIASKTVRIEVNVRHCMFRIHGLRGIRQPSIKWGSTWMNDGSLPSSAMRRRPTQCVGLRRGHRSEVLGLARETSRPEPREPLRHHEAPQVCRREPSASTCATQGRRAVARA